MLHCIYSGKPPHALKGLRKELIWTGRKNHALHFFNVSQKPDITSGGGHGHYFWTRDLWTLLVAVHETIGGMIKEKRDLIPDNLAMWLQPCLLGSTYNRIMLRQEKVFFTIKTDEFVHIDFKKATMAVFSPFLSFLFTFFYFSNRKTIRLNIQDVPSFLSLTNTQFLNIPILVLVHYSSFIVLFYVHL